MNKLPISRIRVILLSILVFTFLLSGCTGNTAIKNAVENTDASTQAKQEINEKPTEIMVWAAAGIKNALSEIAPLFEKEYNVELIFNFASSGDLQTQIEQGAPADVFISAGKKQINALDENQLLIKSSIKNLVANDLIIAAPKKSKIVLSKIEDLATLKDVKRIAMGNPDQVPAGKYAIQALKKTGVWGEVQPKVIYTKDVPQISSYLDSGEVDLGFIYKSELAVTKNVKTVLIVPNRHHDPIVFTGAVVKNAKQRELGIEFINYMQADEAQKVLNDHGFKPISR